MRSIPPHLLTLVVYPEWEAGGLGFGFAVICSNGFHWGISISIRTYARYTHAHNGIFHTILDTSSPQPDDKQDGGRSVRHMAFDMFV